MVDDFTGASVKKFSKVKVKSRKQSRQTMRGVGGSCPTKVAPKTSIGIGPWPLGGAQGSHGPFGWAYCLLAEDKKTGHLAMSCSCPAGFLHALLGSHPPPADSQARIPKQKREMRSDEGAAPLRCMHKALSN